MKQQENIKALFEKYLNNACTAQEIRVLFAYFEGSDKEEELRQLIRSEVADDHYSQPHARDKLDALTGRVETRLIDAIRPKRRPLAAVSLFF